MATDESVKKMRNVLPSVLVDTTRVVAQISNEDLAFHRSTNPSITPLVEEQSSRLLELAGKLMKSATLGTEVTTPYLSDSESVEDNWRNVVDIFDNILEKADACLDEYTGVIRRLNPSQEEQLNRVIPVIGKRRPEKTCRTQNIAKPQRLFGTPPANNDLTPFKPLLRSKPHAITSLHESVALVTSSDGSQRYAPHL